MFQNATIDSIFCGIYLIRCHNVILDRGLAGSGALENYSFPRGRDRWKIIWNRGWKVEDGGRWTEETTRGLRTEDGGRKGMADKRILSYLDLKVYKLAFALQQEIFTLTKQFLREELYALTDQTK